MYAVQVFREVLQNFREVQHLPDACWLHNIPGGIFSLQRLVWRFSRVSSKAPAWDQKFSAEAMHV